MLSGLDAADQVKIDEMMIDLDGTPNKGRLGANADAGRVPGGGQGGGRGCTACRCIATSAACSRARLPVPMMNIINGGQHADNPIDIQNS